MVENKDKHEFCRFRLEKVRKETKFKQKITGLGNYYIVDGKTFEIHACCRWGGKADLILKIAGMAGEQ